VTRQGYEPDSELDSRVCHSLLQILLQKETRARNNIGAELLIEDSKK